MAITFYTADYYALDNFSAHSVEIDGVLYPTSEHAYHASKFTSSEDKEKVRAARSPLQAKELANGELGVKQRPDWEDMKLGAMETVLRAKLNQHIEVLQMLKRTDVQELVENSPYDYFWGCGKDGSGENHLGRLWMKLRTELN